MAGRRNTNIYDRIFIKEYKNNCPQIFSCIRTHISVIWFCRSVKKQKAISQIWISKHVPSQVLSNACILGVFLSCCFLKPATFRMQKSPGYYLNILSKVRSVTLRLTKAAILFIVQHFLLLSKFPAEISSSILLFSCPDSYSGRQALHAGRKSSHDRMLTKTQQLVSKNHTFLKRKTTSLINL